MRTSGSRPLVAIWLVSLMSFVGACGHSDSKKDNDLPPSEDGKGEGEDKPDPKPTKGELSLTIPENKWSASKYCGDIVPDLPENPTPAHHFERDFLNQKLASADGLVGWIHGAVPRYQQYVFTYRKEDATDPMAFFKSEQFALVPQNGDIAKTLATLKRHDKIRIKGRFFDNGSPLPHLMISSLELIKKYEFSTENGYSIDLSKLPKQKTFDVFGQLHATIASDTLGRALVLEHNDLMLPLVVPQALNDVVAPLFRGDILNLAVKVVEHPHGPPHFELDGAAKRPVRVIDPILNCHGVEKTVTGYLAKFEKSPAISTDVYAIRVVDANGIGRNFTLFPASEDPDKFMEVFMGISAKAKAAWDASTEQPAVVRNFRKKESIRVTVRGRLNVVSTEQANAQVYINEVEDVTFTQAQ